MSSELAIRIENVSKCYHIYDKPRDRLRQLFAFGGKKYYREFWALKDVSFDIPKGETVGIIGRNGSGKSTLLQLICGTLEPTNGSIVTNGRIAALLELGAGFNPEFTGRENIFMSCTLLGMSRKEAEDRFDDIASFADIGSFLEQPVKTYSSGMFVRLAFSVNIMSQPEIMVVDEALAVGDMSFQAKCMTALTRIQENGATVLFVSHDINGVKSLCSKAIYLERGLVKSAGNAPDVAEMYMRSIREEMSAEQHKFARASRAFDELDSKSKVPFQELVWSEQVFKVSASFDKKVSAFRYGSGEAQITYVEIVNLDDEPIEQVAFNQEVKIRIYFLAKDEVDVSVSFHVFDDKKINITGAGFANVNHDLIRITHGARYVVEYRLSLPLQEGVYSLRAQITAPAPSNNTANYIDVIPDGCVFRVERWNLSRVWSKVHLFPQLSISQVK